MMIYRLNDEFKKIEETEGLLQNRSEDVEIEFVVCKENSQKDSGAILAPAEKYTFAVKEGENVYARSNKMTGALANLAVLNFKKPASGEAGAGCICETLIDDALTALDKTWSSEKVQNEILKKEISINILHEGSVSTVGTYPLKDMASKYKFLIIATEGYVNTQIIPAPSTTGRTESAFLHDYDADYKINMHFVVYDEYLHVVNAKYVSAGWGFQGLHYIIGVK